MPSENPDKALNPKTQWRHANPDKDRLQRQRELENRKARRRTKRLAREQSQQAELAERLAQGKTCTQCGLKQPLAEFNRRKASPDGRRGECRTCQKRAADNHKPQRQARDLRRKDEIDAQQKKYREENRDVLCERAAKNRRKHKAKVTAYNVAYRAAHLGYFRLAASQYRARKRGLPDHWNAEQEAFMLEYWQHACAACGNPKGLFWTLAHDHYIPLTSPNCPGTVATNMIPLCHGDGGCNNSKYNSEPHEWLVRRFGPKKAAQIEKAIAAYFALVALTFPQEISA